MLQGINIEGVEWIREVFFEKYEKYGQKSLILLKSERDNVSGHQPGHVLELHHFASLLSPWQVELPVHDRNLSDLPLPQVFVHSLQGPQLDQVATAVFKTKKKTYQVGETWLDLGVGMDLFQLSP